MSVERCGHYASVQTTHQASKAIKKKAKTQMLEEMREKDATPVLKFMGVTVAGIHPHLVNDIELTLKTDLRPGKNTFLGLAKDAKLEISKGTEAKLLLRLGRNNQGRLSLVSLDVAFSRSIKIKNPAASLQGGAHHHSKTATRIKDSLADVKLKNIRIDASGNVFVDGHLKAMRVFKAPLPASDRKIALPSIDDAFLRSLGMLPKTTRAGSETADSVLKRFDVNGLLRKLGAITQGMEFALKITGESSRMSIQKDNTYFRGPKAPLDVDVKGTISADTGGDLAFFVDSNNSVVKCSLGCFTPELTGRVHNVGTNQLATIELQGELKGVSKSLKVDTFSKKAVKNMLPRRIASATQIEGPKSENEFNASIGAQKLELASKFDIKASIHKSIERASGKASLCLNASAPYAKTEDRGINMDGNISAFADVRGFNYDKNAGVSTACGSMGFTIHPSKHTRALFPEIASTKYEYGISVTGDGRGKITPPEYGIARFVRPIRNFEGHKERVNGSLTHAPLTPIGSKRYFEQMEKLTGATLRHANEVKLLIDGVQSLPERLKLIEQAKDYICFQTLAFKDDETGWLMAKALAGAAKRGVRVYGIIDSLGNMENLSGLDRPNPIYQYLTDNNVHLKIYNSAVEVGMRSICGLVAKYPDQFRVKSPKSLKSIAQVMRFLERAVEVADDEEGGLPAEERLQLKVAIHSLFNGKEGVSPEVAVNELRDAIRGNMTGLSEILSLIKRGGEASYRWHEKYLIVDHEAAIVGGMNIADEYLLGGTDRQVTIGNKEQPAWRDTDVLLRGDIVVDAYTSFSRNWLHIAQEHLPKGPEIRRRTGIAENDGFAVSMIQHRPLEDGDHNVTNYLLYNLRTLKAGEKAWFETAYFLPRGILRVLQKELVSAAKRGVDVRILTNSEATSDFESLVQASVFDMRELLEAGARIFLRNQNRMVHAKVMVLGDKLTMVGSWNCDNRSATHDSEAVSAIYDSSINQEMTQVLTNDMFNQSNEIHLTDLKNRKLDKEIMSAAMLLAGEMV